MNLLPRTYRHRFVINVWALAAALAHILVYAATSSFYQGLAVKPAQLPALADVGKALFFDPRLSASGKQACATCHQPDHAYGPGNGLSAQPGGLSGKLFGMRAAPSLRYVQNVPVFTEHFHDGENDGDDMGPTGGHTWDGRAASVHDQARLPMFSPLEMANASESAVVAKVKAADYAVALRGIFGERLFDDPSRAMNAILLALEVFQQDPAEFYPYSSKYDAYLRGQVTLSRQEARGLVLFNDAQKGNCAACHTSAIKEGAFPQFSDWGFIALGVPRNNSLPDNRNPAFFDLGLCGPARQDFVSNPAYCGLFRTPTLRNVALRKAFFHNGVFHRLEDVLDFYATRDTEPHRWYPVSSHGVLQKFNDLPSAYQGNVNGDAPFGGKQGATPPLSRADRQDIIAFLKTLTDGFHPPAR
jgi:cytochrome c peroxidase